MKENLIAYYKTNGTTYLKKYINVDLSKFYFF